MLLIIKKKNFYIIMLYTILQITYPTIVLSYPDNVMVYM